MGDIVILGAHTAVGRSVLDRLADRDLTEGVVAATTSEFVEGDLVLLDESSLNKAKVLVLAMQGDLPKKVADAVMISGRPVIDVSETFDDGPYLWPGLGAATTVASGAYRVAVGPAGPLAAALAALSAFRPKTVRVTTLESAVARGQPGIDELSAQTRSVFAMRDADVEVFPASLAFDPIPSLAMDDQDPRAADDALVEQVQDALRSVDVEPPDLVATRVLVPTFVADAAVVHVQTEDREPDMAAVIDALGSGRGLRHLARPVVPVLDAVDRDDSTVSRVRVGPHRIDFWLAYDRTRAGSAMATALALEAWRH